MLVAECGSISKAARTLHLAPQTVSHQLGLLEEQLGTRLLERQGHTWKLTEAGSTALTYAKEIFALGKEMQDALRGTRTDISLRLNVGITDAIPKHVAFRLLEPVLAMETNVSLSCVEGNLSDLADKLAEHTIDLILADRPLTPHVLPKVESFFLYESELSVMLHPTLMPDKPFPEALQGLPFLLLSDHHDLTHSLTSWFQQNHYEPDVVGHFDDSALMKTFARGGKGACCIPRLIEEDVAEEFGLHCIGHITAVTEKYFAIKMQRKVKHPAVEVICHSGPS